MAVGIIYFALVDLGEVFNDAIHNRFDEQVLKLQISQSEGDFASAEVEIVNPGQGLLNPARKKRVFISYQDGANVKLLFSGRIVGFPTDFVSETVQLTFIAQPEDWEVQQQIFLDTLKVTPYYNELFIPEDRRDDAAEILAARSGLIYWDRKTNSISLSDILEGSSEIDLGSNVIFDTVRNQIGDPPVSAVNIVVEAQWEQFGVGTVDAGEVIRQQFTNSAIPTALINTLTPNSFEDAWRGVSIPNGYTIAESKLTPVANGYTLIQSDLRSGTITVLAADFPRANGNTVGNRPVSVPRVWYEGVLKLQAVYEQKRREIFATQLAVDVQDFSLRGNRIEDISIRIQDPTAAPQGSVFNAKLPSFYYDNTLGQLTTFGREVVENAILRGAARLKYANRVIQTKFEGSLNSLVDVTTDHNIRFDDDRLPGGSIRGKVVDYILSIDGDTGQSFAKITLLSSIGLGTDSVPNVTPGEVEIGQKIYKNEFGALTMTSSIFYDLSAAPVIDEPIDVAQMEVNDQYLITGAVVSGDGEAQTVGFLAENILAPDFGAGRPDLFLDANPTSVEVDLRSLNPEPELLKEIQITTTNLTLPKHVDMEA